MGDSSWENLDGQFVTKPKVHFTLVYLSKAGLALKTRTLICSVWDCVLIIHRLDKVVHSTTQI